jgi:hypothetical protein
LTPFIPNQIHDFAFLHVFGSVCFGIVSRRQRRPPKSKNPPQKWKYSTGITGSLSSEWVAGFAPDYPDIFQSAQKIKRFTKDIDFDSFLSDDKTMDAVVRNFEIIGESANRIDSDFRDEISMVSVRTLQVDSNLGVLDRSLRTPRFLMLPIVIKQSFKYCTLKFIWRFEF